MWRLGCCSYLNEGLAGSTCQPRHDDCRISQLSTKRIAGITRVRPQRDKGKVCWSSEKADRTSQICFSRNGFELQTYKSIKLLNHLGALRLVHPLCKLFGIKPDEATLCFYKPLLWANAIQHLIQLLQIKTKNFSGCHCFYQMKPIYSALWSVL